MRDGPRPKVFVSYSRRDLAFATSLVVDLDQRGFQPFLDRTDIAPGEPWQARLSGLIAAADTMVFVVSPDSAQSSICEWEIAEAGRLGKRILPLVCRSTDMNGIPAGLGRLNFIFATSDMERPSALDVLEASLQQDLAWVREHTRLAEIAFRWDKGGRRSIQTLRGSDLEAAESWLAHQPGEASQPTALHRDLVLFSRRAARLRQRAWVGGSAAVALVALGLAGIAELNRRRADDALQAARGTANTLVTDLASGLRDKVGMPVTLVRSILQPALALQDRLISSAGSNVGLRLDQSHALAQMSVTLLRIGDNKEGLATAERSRDIVLALLSVAPKDHNLHTQLLESLRDVAVAEDQVGHKVEARAVLAQLADLARKDPRDIDALIGALTMLAQTNEDPRQDQAIWDEALLRARQVTGPNAPRTLVRVLLQRANRDSRIGALQPALKELDEAYDLALKQVKDETDAAARRDLASTLMLMAMDFFKVSVPDAALAAIDDSLAVSRELAKDKENYLAQDALGTGLLGAGALRMVGGQVQESIGTYEECVALYRSLARDGDHPEARVKLATALRGLGRVNAALPGHSQEAIAELSEAMTLFRANATILPEQSQSLAKTTEALLAKLLRPS